MTAAAINSRTVIVYNNDGYTKLSIISLKKAMRLLALNKAVVHEFDESKGFLRSSGKNAVEWFYPISVRLVEWITVNYEKFFGTPVYTKHGVLRRDKYKCAYCSGKATTIDHVMPRSRGGKNSWLNCVACCFKCNNKKDNKTPEEANMKLKFKPAVPTKTELMGL